MLHIFSKYRFYLFITLFFTISSSYSLDNNVKPNILVIMADDIGIGDLGFYHRQRTDEEAIIPTPNLDNLVQSGMRFNDAHSPASICAPSRYSMLTGNYPIRNNSIFGVWKPHHSAGIDGKSTTSARLAKAGGYHTAFFGKWGLGGVWSKENHSYEKIEAGAMHFGFDYALELPNGIQNNPLAFYENQTFMKIKPDSFIKPISLEQAQFIGKRGRILAPVMMADSNWDPSLAGGILATKASEYITRQVKDHPNKPFYMYYSTQAVHIPHTPIKHLDGKKVAGTTPSAYGDMIYELDVQIGLLIKTLKNAGVYNNTLIIFTSDNGGLNYDKNMNKAGHDSSNGLRKIKGSIYEGGHRVPFLASWEAKIKPNTVSNTPIVSHDVVATIAALSGQKINREETKDSLNLLPLFLGKELKSKRQYLLHQSKGQPYFSIRKGDWKLIMEGNSKNKRSIESLKPIGLFNLKDNIQENEKDNKVNDPNMKNMINAMMKAYKTLIKENKGTVIEH